MHSILYGKEKNKKTLKKSLQTAVSCATSSIASYLRPIENLESINIATNSIDLVISNSVINLSPDKERMFREIFRVLKPGGELCFSAIYADPPILKEAQENKALRRECLTTALYLEDFRRMLSTLGYKDIPVMEKNSFGIHKPELEKKIAMIQFYSITHRCFKLNMEDSCEDYGQMTYYRGNYGLFPATSKEYTLCLD